jgi:hypothetical protein
VKKILTILIIVGFIAPALVVYAYLLREKNLVKEANSYENTSLVARAELIELKFSLDEIEQQIDWENEHEFEWKNKMYDVVRQEKKADSIRFWCKYDDEETLINEQLGEVIAYFFVGNSTKRETQQLLEKVFKNLYCYLPEKQVHSILASQLSHHASASFLLNECNRLIPSPPPEDN